MDNSFWVNYGEYIVGIPALIIGTAVTIWIFIRQKNIKKLEYRIIANESLLSYHKDLEKDLVILFKDKKIDNLAFLLLEFENTGNISIIKSDFDSNLDIKFKNYTAIFGIELINIYPKNIDLNTIREIDSFSIEPYLINPKDKFSVKILYDNKSFDYEINARIAGVKEITKASESKDFSLNSFLVVLFITIASLGVIFTITKGLNFLIENLCAFIIGIILIILIQLPRIFKTKN